MGRQISKGLRSTSEGVMGTDMYSGGLGNMSYENLYKIVGQLLVSLPRETRLTNKAES